MNLLGGGAKYTLEFKALYESILYYLRESLTHKNNNLSFILLTNTRDFYCIDAKEFVQFAKHKEIQKAFKNCEHKEGNDTSTQKFYDELKLLLPSLDSTLAFTHFRLEASVLAQDLHTSLLPLIYQALNPAVLLKRKSYIDANTLNVGFYNELLYILGLEEQSQNGKVLIKANETKNTLLDTLCTAFAYDKDRDFESASKLITTWNNRLLFLRLVESMLLSFKHISKPFLNADCLPTFATLNTLFFDVLAKEESKREAHIPQSLSSIPYLNSSLFDKTPLELQGKEIARLDSKPLVLYQDSILYKDKTLSKSFNLNAQDSTLPLLEYFFAFLHAYNFTTTAQDIQNHIKINYDKLINSAVLGLVFEKLNGYKEGSFYTPSFITSWVCKQSLQKVILEKFNTAKNWQCADLEALKHKLNKLTDSKEGYKETNSIFDTIRVCDPSVGSGHFLVSALNELILLKFQLQILCDEHFERLKDITLSIENDEILVRDSHNAPFTYTLPAHENIESHKIQKAFFFNKRKLIESCLFGVDINPNSCEITKLRLWIELLKYSFYKDIANKRLETLPNIDINIKCGNSLVSYMGIEENLLLHTSEQIKRYQKLESDYFNGFYRDKDAMIKKIEKVKQDLLNQHFEFKFKDSLENLKKECENYSKSYGDYAKESLGQHYKFIKNHISISGLFEQNLDEQMQEKAQKELEKLKSEHDKIFNLSKNFEWRIEFPKLLDTGLSKEQITHNNQQKQKGNFKNLYKDESGKFLGFDLVIGNPPYIRQEEIKELKPHLQKVFSIYKGTSDIYTYFFEQGYKILKKNGILSFITPNKWCRAGYGEPLREFLLESTKIHYYIDFNGVKVFESATVDTSILEFAKAKAERGHTLNYANPKDYNPKENKPLEESLELTQIPQDSLSTDSFIFTSPEIAVLKAKIEKIGTPLKDWDINIYRGILTGYNEAFIIDSEKRAEILNACANDEERARTSELIKPILRWRDIKRYGYEWAGLWIINTHNGYTIDDSSLGSFCHSERSEESPNDSKRDISGKSPQYDKEKIKIPPIDINEYPTLKAYFDEVAKSGKQGKGKGFYNRDDKGITPYNLRNCAYLQEFAKPKIVYSEIVREPQFYLDNGEFKFGHFYAEATSFILSGNKNFKSSLEYLLGLLHSKLCTFAFKEFYAGGGLGESGYRYKKAFLENLPIPKLDKKQEAEFIAIVQEIIECKKSNAVCGTHPKSVVGVEGEFEREEGATSQFKLLRPLIKDTKLESLESRLDSLIYKAYGLSENEINLIESEFSKQERERERERENRNN
ncbi:Eco57I restriction-modification methylase domain-containing protein [Campylobacter sp. MIT 21-1685]|uniref:type IIG restriction enzyme/methyltransferase n=1 Tax=Campylobacter sp. MIT 21-1685 TaxID=2994323 RepID=UPI00224ADBFD|nr:Eco57I restriction-modification methylase domain-containing protein [Campylobacter sp. MIT 21-1685]MCX2808013.1 Eco57I restriction-modification methylase domain-containing protein [Campylobacter sp. MIT 21-1685]